MVGESGCGKSTLGRTILHLTPSTSGKIFFEGEDITSVSRARLKELRHSMQMIFQDPFASLNPRMTVSEIIAEPLNIYKICSSKAEREKKVCQLMDTVGLSQRLYNAYPHELDGGRRQRIGIARSIAVEPKFIVCDEPVSALDVSIQAQILNLMKDLQESRGLTYMFITHDLSVVHHISDSIMVMYMGQMVEFSPTDALFQKQYHPYTKALLEAVPIPDPDCAKNYTPLMGEISSPINPGSGCRFAPRCQFACEECFRVTPPLVQVEENHFAACHKVTSALAQM